MEIEEKERAEKKKRGAKVTAVCLAALILLLAGQNSLTFLANGKDNCTHRLF